MAELPDGIFSKDYPWMQEPSKRLHGISHPKGCMASIIDRL